LTAIAAGNLNSADTSISFKRDGKFSAFMPCASLGFNFFVY
jgi:hypothetical protein